MNSENERQERNRHFVKNNIGECQSYLVEELFKREVFSYDDIINLYEPVTREKLLELLETQVDEEDFAELQRMSWDDLKNQCDQEIQDIEDNREPQEIFEWYIVNEWMADKLKEQGEPVLENDYGYWWGRTCTGQAILLDHVIDRIIES